MNKLPRRFYEFAFFRVDVLERQLWRKDELVPLTPKVFDILLALLENSGRTVEKEELLEKVWADTFVEEGNLNRNISTLRKVLGDDSHEQRFIKTIPKLGYRFTADVREILEDNEELFVEDKTSYQLRVFEEIRENNEQVEKENYSFSAPHRFRIFISVFGLILILGIVTAWIWNWKGQNGKSSLVTEAEKSEAMELYQRGRELWHTRDAKNLHRAILMLEQSIEKNPNFAPAHSALADAYAFDFRHWKKAEKTANEAIRLDPKLGEPHATIGFVKMFWEWKFQEAENEFKQAIRLSPNYATAHQWYAINLQAIGSSGDAAFVEINKALQIEPFSVSINADFCQALYLFRRYDEAIAQCKKTLAMDEKFYNANLYLYEIYTAKGMYSEAVKTYFKIEEANSGLSSTEMRKKLRDAFSTGDIRSFWEKRIELLSEKSPLNYRIARYYARLGKKNEALFHLKKAYESRDFEFYLFLADPVFDEIRFDSRYLELKKLLLETENIDAKVPAN